MHIGFFACFHGIFLECSRFKKVTFYFSGSRSSEAAGIANKAASSRISVEPETDIQTHQVHVL